MSEAGIFALNSYSSDYHGYHMHVPTYIFDALLSKLLHIKIQKQFNEDSVLNFDQQNQKTWLRNRTKYAPFQEYWCRYVVIIQGRSYNVVLDL